MAAPKVEENVVRDTLAAMYIDSHAGTFNGCMDTMATTLDDFLKRQVVLSSL